MVSALDDDDDDDNGDDDDDNDDVNCDIFRGSDWGLRLGLQQP